jgi:hypothetical protein
MESLAHPAQAAAGLAAGTVTLILLGVAVGLAALSARAAS